MIRFILVVVLLAAIPLPAVGQITLHGSPVPTEVDVYRLAAPEIVPAVAPSGEEPAQSKGKGPVWTLMHPLILEHQITPKTSRYTRCSMSMLPNVSINGRIRSSGQLGRWWYSISPCRNSECVRRFTVFAFNQRS